MIVRGLRMDSSIIKIILSVYIFHFTRPANSSADGFASVLPVVKVLMYRYNLGSQSLQPVTVIRGGDGGGRGLQLRAGLVDGLWKQHPFLAAAIVCATKAAAADLVAQRRSQQRSNSHDKSIDLKRTLSFVLYGALYQGVVQEFIYNNLYSRMFGDSPTLAVIATKVGFDAIFHNALICVPMAYIVKACVFRYSLREGLRRYRDDVLHHGLLLKYYAIWIPVNFCVYAFIPKHFRITTMAVVSFFWMTILSTIASRTR